MGLRVSGLRYPLSQDEVWKKGWIEGKETYIKIVKIKPPYRGKCKRGRIRTTCDPALIGLEAKITIVKPKETDNEWDE